MPNIVLALTGASGAHAADLLVQKSPWPVTLVASRWGRDVYERECGPFERIAGAVDRVLDDDDLSASVASGSVPTEGMVVLPCSSNTMAQIAAGLGSTLVARAAHCHLKEGRKLVLCVREAPWTVMDLDNARAVATAGGIVMPLSPPFYQSAGTDPAEVNMTTLLSTYVDRVLSLLGHPASSTWEDAR